LAAEEHSFSRSLQLKIVGGVGVSVLSALLITYLTPNNDVRLPENPGLERFEHVQGVLTLQYPRFLGRVSYQEVPGSVFVVFGNATTVIAALASKDVSFFDFARDDPAGLSFLAVKVYLPEPADSRSFDDWLEIEEDWFHSTELVTTRRGKPPKKSVYIEKRFRLRFLGEQFYWIDYFEEKEGIVLHAFASIDAEKRKEYAAEIDQTFETIALHPDAARRVLLDNTQERRNP